MEKTYTLVTSARLAVQVKAAKGLLKLIGDPLTASMAGGIAIAVAIVGALLLITCEFQTVKINSSPTSTGSDVLPPYSNAQNQATRPLNKAMAPIEP